VQNLQKTPVQLGKKRTTGKAARAGPRTDRKRSMFKKHKKKDLDKGTGPGQAMELKSLQRGEEKQNFRPGGPLTPKKWKCEAHPFGLTRKKALWWSPEKRNLVKKMERNRR